MKITKNRRTKNKRTKNRKTKNRKTKKYKKIGGELRNNCIADPTKFPKCGNEGCVYLDNENYVTKKQWKHRSELQSNDLSIEGQTRSKGYSPDIISTNVKPCDQISKIGSENRAPCFVKRFRNTKSGEKIIYEEEKRDSWCRNYGVENQCVVDENMYNKFKANIKKSVVEGKQNIRSFVNILPEVDDFLDGDSNAIQDEELGDLHQKIKINEDFTNLNPIFITDIKMNRIKGITIEELIKEMLTVLGEEKTMSVSQEWEDEKNKLIRIVSDIGYTSNDFHEQNIMIDVDDETLCSWIDSILATGNPITPEQIKQHFRKEEILKIVDWGMLRRTK